MMQNRLKDRDRGGYTSDRYRPHDNYTNAFNMLAQIGLAEKEVTNSMRNAVTQAANVKALQDRLKFDVSSYSAKLKQLELDYSTGQKMTYENLIQTYMDDNEEKRKEKIMKWVEKNKDNKDYDDDGFKEAFNAKVDEYKKMDIEAAKEKYKEILGIIESHSKATQQHIKEFDNVFGFHSNDSNVLDNKNSNVSDNKNSARKIIGSPIIKTNAIIGEFFKNFEMGIDTAKEKYKAISDSIKSHSDATQKYIEEFDNAIRSSIKNTNAIIGEFFKNFFNKGGER